MNNLWEIAAGNSLPELSDADAAEDFRLMRLAQDDCPDAFRSLVERHQQRLYHFCYRYLRNAEDAREVCQDTFVRAHAAMPRFKPKARVSTWLYQIALNLCRDRMRAARRRRTGSASEAAETSCPASTPDQAAMLGGDLAKLDRGLAAMSEKSRSVLVMSCLDGLSHEECAAILKCSERAVEGRLYRARRELAAWWHAHGG
ncbi:RNA polymerase sigma factor [Haloferula chungangensis]|uniref:RNA polymerase sigma factor n=1 Tax=Haloferula chungangensis TaxID=1048331 RepID=A0ABW2LA50_9BACT